MLHAAELALRGRAGAAPNPCVGAVLARGGQIVAEGWHAQYGGPHAEVNCLADAAAKGVDPAGCTLNQNKETYNQHSKTTPSTNA